MGCNCPRVGDLLEKIKQNNQMFSEEQVDLLKNLTGSQHPKITLVSCSDSRVDPNYFKINSLDKIFTVRNMGNSILTSEGSVNYGINHLETPVLMILAHTNCGAIHTAINSYHKVDTGIKKELNNIMPALLNLKETTDQKRWVEGVESNLDLQINIAESMFKDRVEAGKLIIIGGILDIDDSYNQGIGKVHFKRVVGSHECQIDLEYS